MSLNLAERPPEESVALAQHRAESLARYKEARVIAERLRNGGRDWKLAARKALKQIPEPLRSVVAAELNKGRASE